MSAQTVISRAQNQGGRVSLAKPGDPVSLAKPPSGDVIRPAVSMNGHPIWDVVYATPRPVIIAWIGECLAEGDYADASHLSRYLHAPAPVLPEGAMILR